MPPNAERLEITTIGDVTIVAFTDKKILDELNIAQLENQLAALTEQGSPPKIVLDFGNVAHMSSSALGMLITLYKRVRQREGQLRLCNIQPAIYKGFVITRLNEIFHITQTREQALGSL